MYVQVNKDGEDTEYMTQHVLVHGVGDTPTISIIEETIISDYGYYDEEGIREREYHVLFKQQYIISFEQGETSFVVDVIHYYNESRDGVGSYCYVEKDGDRVIEMESEH